MATLLAPQDSTNMSQAQWQEMFQGLFSNGVISAQLNQYVTTTTSGLGISVASGKAMIQGFFARSDAAVALTAAAADPTNPRIDRAVLHADLSAHTLTVILLTGAPAPSPAPPALTQTGTVWEISLYQVRVNAGAVTISSLTDERTFSNVPVANRALGVGDNANSSYAVVTDDATNLHYKPLGLTTRGLSVETRDGSNALHTIMSAANDGTSARFFGLADNATNATTATNATNSTQLGGVAAAGYAIVGTHSAGQVKISYGTGVPGALDANEIYFQIS